MLHDSLPRVHGKWVFFGKTHFFLKIPNYFGKACVEKNH